MRLARKINVFETGKSAKDLYQPRSVPSGEIVTEFECVKMSKAQASLERRKEVAEFITAEEGVQGPFTRIVLNILVIN